MIKETAINLDMQVLRKRHLTEQIGVGGSTIYDWMNPRSPRYDSTFPKPIKLGKAAVGWLAGDIFRWLESRAEADSRRGNKAAPADAGGVVVRGGVQ